MQNKPLMQDNEIELIEKYLNKDVNMLEYGSGNSTLYYSERVRKLTSLEYNRRWFNKVDEQVKKLPHVKLVFIPCKKVKPATYKEYKEYIDWPKSQKEIWDVVLIDGRARQWCAKSILDNITKDSVVFVHDWGPLDNPKRERYNRILDWYEVVEEAHSLVALRKK